MTRLLIHPIFWVIALMPFVWWETFHIGGMSIKLPYIFALALLGVAVITPVYYRGTASILRSFGIWLVAYALYLPILTLSLAGSEAQGMPIRQMFFAISALVCAGWFAENDQRGNMLRAAGFSAVLLTVVVIEILARSVGLSWLDAIMSFFTSGDLDFIIYGFFRRVFNAASGDEAAAVGAAAKNSLAVAVFTAGVMFRSGHKGEGRDRIGILSYLLILGLLVMLNTRSVLIIALLSLPFTGLITLVRSKRISLTKSVVALLTFVSTIVSLFLLGRSENALMSTLVERFSFTDASAGSRFDQLIWALTRIEQSMWLGTGYAEIDGHPVHNLFVGAWMHAGLAAFILVAVVYLGLLCTWLRFVTQITLHPTMWKISLRPEWIAVLPMVPMFRVWLSGDAGHMDFVEWSAIGCFLGILVANRLALPRATTSQVGRHYKITEGQHT